MNCIIYNFEIFFIEEETDLSICEYCLEQIYSNMIVPILFYNGNYRTGSFRVCKSCFEIVNKEDPDFFELIN